MLFSELDKSDLREFYRIYDFAKVDSVDAVVETCVARNIGPEQLFADLYSLHNVARLQDRETAARRLREAVPEATAADVESAMRQSEMKGFTASDALRALRRRVGARRTSAALTVVDHRPNELGTSANAVLNYPKLCFAGPSREAMDNIMADECREWVANVVGDAHNAAVLREANFVDALRDGVVLLVLLQKLQNPLLLDHELRLPKRASGFYARDNVVLFLKEAARVYQLVEAQLFTDSDLCDGKNDRGVVSCLLSIARVAYARGSTKIAPAMIIYEQEIDAKLKSVTQEQIDDMIVGAGSSETVDLEVVANEMEEKRYVVDMSSQIESTKLLAHSASKQQPETKLDATVLNKETKDIAKAEGEGRNANHVTTNKDNKVITTPAVTGNGTFMVAEENKESMIEEIHKNSNYITDKLEFAKCSEKVEPDLYPSETAIKNESGNMNISLVAGAKSKEATKLAAAPAVAPKYYPRKSDVIDNFFAIAVNAHFCKHPYSQIRFHRLSSSVGEYIAYHRTVGHKRLLYARILQGKLLIRQSGKFGRGVPSWEDLQNWLERYEVECGA